ncbi:MAG: Hsp20/alpha crystallin family protein [Desulfobacteraceae bacterium]|nr:Hsp20/alpha crystallin family protein [Desulfobacteraceae bacterium]
MQLMRWSPMRDVFKIGNDFDSIFNNFFAPDTEYASKTAEWNPAVDIYENEDTYVIKAELPGMKKDEITIDVKERKLILKGERQSENEEKKEKYHYKERIYGKFQRIFILPQETNPETINAEYKDGVLKVQIPKPQEPKPKQIAIH